MTEELAVRVRLIDARLAQLEAAKTEKAIRGIGKGAETAGKQSREASGHFGLMSRAMGGFRFAAGAAGFASLAFGIKDVVSAGMKLQEQQSQLRGALTASGVKGSQAFDQINQAAEKLAGKGGFAVPEQLQGMTQFVRVTGSATKAIRLNAAATNLARGAHVDFTRAQMMLQRVIATGTIGRFAPYLGMMQAIKTHVDALTAAHKLNVAGINAQARAMGKAGAAWKAQQLLAAGVAPQALENAKMLDKQATAQAVLAAVQRKYGDASAAYSHTAAGAMGNLKNVLESLMGRLGLLILPLITKVARALSGFVAGFQAHLPQIKRVFKDVFGPVKDIVVGAFGAIVSVVKDATHWFEQHKAVAVMLAGALGGLAVALAVIKINLLAGAAAEAILNMTMLANPIVLVVAAIGALAAGLVYAYEHCKTFRQIVQDVFGWLKTNVPPIIDSVVGAFKSMFAPIVQVFNGIVQQLQGFWEIIKGMFTLNAGLAWRGVEDVFRGAVKTVGGIIMTITAPFRLAFEAVKGVVKPVIDWLVNKIKWIVNAAKSVGSVVSSLNPFASHHETAKTLYGFEGARGHASALRRASGGPVPGYGAGDSVPALLTPGEFVVQRQIVNQVGMPAMQHFNQTGSMPSGNITIEPAPVSIFLEGRPLAEAVLRFSLKKAARGAHSLSGGSLVTG